jgi:hypothetical protein
MAPLPTAPQPSEASPGGSGPAKAALELLQPGSVWQLEWPLNLYSRAGGRGLATQAAAGRCLQVLGERADGRLRVRLLEDGYPGWLEPGDLVGRAVAAQRPRPLLLQRQQISQRLPGVLALAQSWMERANVYLWGGTVGPDLDCSGLVQTAYAAAGIWLPRDAYLQERFCLAVAVRPGDTQLLEPGDLIFFGTPQRCTHVGLHLGGGRYLHSSGQEHGRNGLGIDDLNPRNRHPVASHYRRELRGAGRVMRCHDGSPLPA